MATLVTPMVFSYVKVPNSMNFNKIEVRVLKEIVSGGQTGADIAGVDAAIDAGFEYGGWLPKGRKTESGPLDVRYEMVEMSRGGYPKRTEQNIIDSDGTVIFVKGKLTGGSALTRKLAIKHKKPWLHLNTEILSVSEAGTTLTEWLNDYDVEILNVAGRSASKDSNIYKFVYATISRILADEKSRQTDKS